MDVTMGIGRWYVGRGVSPDIASFANMLAEGSSISVSFARSPPAGNVIRICLLSTDGRGRRSRGRGRGRRDGLLA